MMKTFLIVVVLLSGCAEFNSQKVVARYHIIDKDGVTKTIEWENSKEIVGLDARVTADGFTLKVEKSGTLAEVVAASLKTQEAILRLLDRFAAGAGPLAAGS